MAKKETLTSLASIRYSVHITIREHLSLSLLRDGGIKSLELKGDLDLKITDSSLSKLKLILSPVSEKASDLGKDLQFQQHPNVAKFAGGAGADRVVALKNADRSFPVGQGLMVLKWRLSTKDESIVPLTGEYCHAVDVSRCLHASKRRWMLAQRYAI